MVHTLPIERGTDWVESYLWNSVFRGLVVHIGMNDLCKAGGNIRTVPAFGSEYHTIRIAISDRKMTKIQNFADLTSSGV